MTKDKREMSLAKIRESPSTKAILISFKAGSTGEFVSRELVDYVRALSLFLVLAKV